MQIFEKREIVQNGHIKPELYRTAYLVIRETVYLSSPRNCRVNYWLGKPMDEIGFPVFFLLNLSVKKRLR